ncbi:MAG: hypothetical protein Q4B26_03785 [Eubacteriales bacterium]|nr:hypothetical protein [Eubacteriales bacterium]
MGTARKKPKYRNVLVTGAKLKPPKYPGDNMDWLREKYQPGDTVMVRKGLEECEDMGETKKTKQQIWALYTVIKAYRWHLLCQSKTGYMESFIWSDVMGMKRA